MVNVVRITETQSKITYPTTTNATIASVLVDGAIPPRMDLHVQPVKIREADVDHNQRKPNVWYSPKTATRRKQLRVPSKIHLVDCVSRDFIHVTLLVHATISANHARNWRTTHSGATGIWKGQNAPTPWSRQKKMPKREQKRNSDSRQFPRTRSVTDVQDSGKLATENTRVISATPLDSATPADHRD
jgi:hypothetical protein